jgi:cbb3-type cytochrome oxidase subunit 3
MYILIYQNAHINFFGRYIYIVVYNSYSKYAKVALVIALLIIFISIGYAYSTYGKEWLKTRRRDVANSQISTNSSG